HGAHAEFGGGPHHADGDLASIGNEQGLHSPGIGRQGQLPTSAVRSAAASRASCSTRPQSRALIASGGATQDPPTQATVGSARNCGAFSSVTPPVGQNR